MKMFFFFRILNWLLVFRFVCVLVFCFVFLYFILLFEIFLLFFKKILFLVLNIGMILRRLDCCGYFWIELIFFGRRFLYKNIGEYLNLIRKIY